MKDDKNTAINEFIKGIDKGPFKCLRNSEEKESKVVSEANDNLNIYKCAVYQAWLDTCRTVEVKNNEEEYENIREQIAGILEDYFTEMKKEFDDWYEDSLSAIDNKHENCLTVGQEQKIINMAFKYLYCCDDYRNNPKYCFEQCHMPLDSYTLGWFKEIEKKGKRKDKVYKGEAWSSIDDYDEYIGIQNRIREVLGDKKALDEEFIIWPQEKIKNELKELKAIKKRCEGNNYFKEILSKDSETESIKAWLKDLIELD